MDTAQQSYNFKNFSVLWSITDTFSCFLFVGLLVFFLFYEDSKVCVTGIVLKCQAKRQLLWLRKWVQLLLLSRLSASLDNRHFQLLQVGKSKKHSFTPFQKWICQKLTGQFICVRLLPLSTSCVCIMLFRHQLCTAYGLGRHRIVE